VSTVASIKAALDALGTDNIATRTDWFVITQAQYDLLKADADRGDVVPQRTVMYRPDGSPIVRMTRGPAMLGVPVVIREVGQPVSLPGTVTDLRSA
jgi:hypothetical protein